LNGNDAFWKAAVAAVVTAAIAAAAEKAAKRRKRKAFALTKWNHYSVSMTSQVEVPDLFLRKPPNF